MDADLVEKITRLVLSRIEEQLKQSVLNEWGEQSFVVDERVEYPPLTKEEMKQWNKITSTMGFSKRADEISPHQVPLTLKELKTWNDLSVSISSKEPGQGRVKFFPHHEWKVEFKREELFPISAAGATTVLTATLPLGCGSSVGTLKYESIKWI